VLLMVIGLMYLNAYKNNEEVDDGSEVRILTPPLYMKTTY
jgi:hypothetical protein